MSLFMRQRLGANSLPDTLNMLRLGPELAVMAKQFSAAGSRVGYTRHLVSYYGGGLDYSFFIYDSASESSKTTLDSVHHSALHVVTGAFRTLQTSCWRLSDSMRLPHAEFVTQSPADLQRMRLTGRCPKRLQTATPAGAGRLGMSAASLGLSFLPMNCSEATKEFCTKADRSASSIFFPLALVSSLSCWYTANASPVRRSGITSSNYFIPLSLHTSSAFSHHSPNGVETLPSNSGISGRAMSALSAILSQCLLRMPK